MDPFSWRRQRCFRDRGLSGTNSKAISLRSLRLENHRSVAREQIGSQT